MEEENVARAILKDAGISSKHAIEICSHLRHKKVAYAKEFLGSVIKKEKAVKFTRFTAGAGHKTGIGPGKYPKKASEIILQAIESAESNAIDKGLGLDLKIVHLSAQRASTPWHYGRQSRRKTKRTHIEVVIQEVENKQKKVAKEKTSKKEEVKQDQTIQKEIKETKEIKDVLKKVASETPKENIIENKEEHNKAQNEVVNVQVPESSDVSNDKTLTESKQPKIQEKENKEEKTK
ncbi:50S ribosomal protein L22 [Candidatus Woesearchaeota archaeon]|nr:50S ribosomal protein L22 [Candidatus Woesearchaeota archaeon]